MNDAVRRNEVINALENCYCGGEDSCGEPWIYKDHAIKAAEQLPPAELGTNLAEVGTDCISRQQAIDAVMECYDNDELFEVYEWKLNELPPIQPEIVRCKDCKHWIPYDWMFNEVWRSKNMADYPEDEIGCNWCDMAMKADDFCSRADMRGVNNESN